MWTCYLCGATFDAMGGGVCRVTGEPKPICRACIENRQQSYRLANSQSKVSDSVNDNLTENVTVNQEMIDKSESSQTAYSKTARSKKPQSRRKSSDQRTYYGGNTGNSRPPSLNYEAALERKRERDAKTGGIPEYEDGYPRDEFGTRDDHKKMRGRDWGDMKRRSRE